MNITDLYQTLRQLPPSTDLQHFGNDTLQSELLEQMLRQLGVQPTQVDEITEILELERGRVFAVRWDLTAGEAGFKLPVMASLLLYHLWRRKSSVEDIHVLCDGGNINTALALGHLAKRLGLHADHVLSRHFPEFIRAYLRERGGNDLTLIEAPATRLGKEREFYSHLVKVMRDPSRRGTSLCLWHAKYGGIATRWLGDLLCKSWDIAPDDIVLGLGSGSTLESFAFPLKQRFGDKPRILVAEHEKSPLIKAPVIANLTDRFRQPSRFSSEFVSPPATIPHSILGPHYDEINPFLSDSELACIDGVVRYGDGVWQDTSHLCRLANMPVGNSSAANLAVARHLAAQGRTVFTFIYEPLREIYLERQADHQFPHKHLHVQTPIQGSRLATGLNERGGGDIHLSASA